MTDECFGCDGQATVEEGPGENYNRRYTCENCGTYDVEWKIYHFRQLPLFYEDYKSTLQGKLYIRDWLLENHSKTPGEPCPLLLKEALPEILMI